jgi:Protein of unknown function (DUF3891)
VIVRERPDSFVLFEQHRHGLFSGEFARHWAARIPIREAALYAIANHDVGWRELDETVRWNDETGSPYSFLDYPVGPKLRAYANGLDYVQAHSPYAACLCSMHYGSFVRDARREPEISFREAEAARRRGIEATLSEEEIGGLEYNFRLLQLCDDLSLFVCLNEPGRNDYPHYRDGFGFMGTRLQPVWEDERTLRLDPNPFSEDFWIELPYLVCGKDRRPLGNGILELRVTC